MLLWIALANFMTDYGTLLSLWLTSGTLISFYILRKRTLPFCGCPICWAQEHTVRGSNKPELLFHGDLVLPAAWASPLQ